MHDTIGIHYPSKDAPPLGVWWLDEATGTVRHYPLASRRREPLHSASPSTATRSGPATSWPAGSGRSSGSKAAGCSRCRRCSSPRPSGWSAAAPSEGCGPPQTAPNAHGPWCQPLAPLAAQGRAITTQNSSVRASTDPQIFGGRRDLHDQASVSCTRPVFTSRSQRKITCEETAGQVLPGAAAKA
jgi:hypothetical protein